MISFKKKNIFKWNIGLKDGIDNLIGLKFDTSDKRFKHEKSVTYKICKMEDIRSILYHQIDIVTTKDYGTLDMLIKIELQAKLLSLNVISPESFLTVLKLPKRDLIELILSMNLYYEDNEENVSETHEENDMDEGMDNGQNDYQENNFYNYYGGISNHQQYWQYNQHYHQDQDQEQWQQWQYWQQWNQWNGHQ